MVTMVIASEVCCWWTLKVVATLHISTVGIFYSMGILSKRNLIQVNTPFSVLVFWAIVSRNAFLTRVRVLILIWSHHRKRYYGSIIPVCLHLETFLPKQNFASREGKMFPHKFRNIFVAETMFLIFAYMFSNVSGTRNIDFTIKHALNCKSATMQAIVSYKNVSWFADTGKHGETLVGDNNVS